MKTTIELQNNNVSEDLIKLMLAFKHEQNEYDLLFEPNDRKFILYITEYIEFIANNPLTNIMFTAKYGDKLVGFIGGKMILSPNFMVNRITGFIDFIFVLEPYRKKGIARKLFNAIMVWMKYYDPNIIQFNCSVNNDMMRFLAERENFSVIGYGMERKCQDNIQDLKVL